jgi:tRNA-2-methylthio-N6-dimethylallyladenosine synthase
MGCMVGPGERQIGDLRARFPHVSVFAPPQQEEIILEAVAPVAPNADMDVACVPGVIPDDRLNVAAYVSVIFGCDEFCTFCIVPYRRGRERSRPIPEIVTEVESLVARGVREVTLLGQIVDSYGHDLPDKPDLANLLEAVNEVEGLDRVRFLTSTEVRGGSSKPSRASTRSASSSTCPSGRRRRSPPRDASPYTAASTAPRRRIHSACLAPR